MIANLLLRYLPLLARMLGLFGSGVLSVSLRSHMPGCSTNVPSLRSSRLLRAPLCHRQRLSCGHLTLNAFLRLRDLPLGLPHWRHLLTFVGDGCGVQIALFLLSLLACCRSFALVSISTSKKRFVLQLGGLTLDLSVIVLQRYSISDADIEL